jgi:hypothetical protein
MEKSAARRDIAEIEQALLRQCEIIKVVEDLVRAVDATADVADDARGMDLLRLPLLVEATAEALRTQAETFETWAARIAPLDPLLRRSLHELVAALVFAAEAAVAATEQATDFAADAQLANDVTDVRTPSPRGAPEPQRAHTGTNGDPGAASASPRVLIAN